VPLVAVTGLSLRYALLLVLDAHGDRWCSPSELLDGLARLGLAPPGARPAEVVADALRGEVARGRAVGHGRYAIGHLPGVTRHRARVVVPASTASRGCR
jgi:hypothetical protein